jgi:hypothetical protein
MARSGGDARTRQQELLGSLHAAVDTLSACLQQIEDLMHQVERHLSEPGETPAVHARAHVSYGGGPSVIGSRDPLGELREHTSAPQDPGSGRHDSLLGSGDRRRGLERRADIEERRLVGERRMPRQGERLRPGTSALMAATELAHLGYTREEIAARLRERWGDRAAAILREALD